MVLRRRAVGAFNRVLERVRGIGFVRSASKASISNVLKERGLEIVYMIVFFTFAAGVVNGLLEGTDERVQSFVIYPGRGIQTPPETFMYFFAMILGTLGVYLLYMSGRQTVRKRISDFYIMLGFTVLLIAFTLTLYIFDIKSGM